MSVLAFRADPKPVIVSGWLPQNLIDWLLEPRWLCDSANNALYLTSIRFGRIRIFQQEGFVSEPLPVVVLATAQDGAKRLLATQGWSTGELFDVPRSEISITGLGLNSEPDEVNDTKFTIVAAVPAPPL